VRYAHGMYRRASPRVAGLTSGALVATALFVTVALSGCVMVRSPIVMTAPRLEADAATATATARAAAAAAVRKSAMDAAHRQAAGLTHRDWYLIKPLGAAIVPGDGGVTFAGVPVHASGLPDTLYVLRRPQGQATWDFVGCVTGPKADRPRFEVPSDVWNRLLP
jgi:hypothetical protein